MGHLNRKTEEEPGRVIKVQVHDLMVCIEENLAFEALNNNADHHNKRRQQPKVFSVWMK